MAWNLDTDELGFQVSVKGVSEAILSGKKKPTKRQFLSVIMSVYDPLGLLTPVTLSSRIVMQAVWRSGVKWDEKLRDEEHDIWKNWLKALEAARNYRVPRCLEPRTRSYTHVELHVFCDASLEAYAAMAYARFIDKDTVVGISLIMSRARVAPLKPLTIPRLELQAALLGARLRDTLIKELDFDFSRKVLWSDSTTVLHWIRNEPCTKQTYVAHRLGEIGDLTRANEWRWLPSRANPADKITRWTWSNEESLAQWATVPALLYQSEQSWPVEKALSANAKDEADRIEKRPALVFHANLEELPLTTVRRALGWKPSGGI
ncbi:uncharacterized protein LOC111693534 [Trichogramma pretiosum]|uniref:uncharacterized protein LOC111693534 n=1 Tax=Trichogramma pretiosum TaxID=7493 RepID=UPI000C71C87A|nr:uncharacterized protein LOC111693534 [Trichogramma pretiosum]